MESNIKAKAKLVLESIFKSNAVAKLLEGLTPEQIKYWAIFAHFYEKGFSKLSDKAQLKKLHHKLKRQPRQDQRKAVDYFYNYRKSELGINESTEAWEKTLKNIAKNKQLKMLSKKDKETLLKIAQMMKSANESVNEESATLPKTVSGIKKSDKVKPPTDTKKAKEYFKHHSLHNGPHIKGTEAEHATYDFDDDDYEVDGGIQSRSAGQKRGYEPVEKISKANTIKIKEADTTANTPGTKGYAAFLTDADIPKQRRSLESSIEKTTGYKMIKEDIKKMIAKELYQLTKGKDNEA